MIRGGHDMLCDVSNGSMHCKVSDITNEVFPYARKGKTLSYRMEIGTTNLLLIFLL
jgi:hypothetical protein